MGTLRKLTEPPAVSFDIPEADFSEPVRVQGGQKRTCGNAVRVSSANRYKLFTEAKDYIRILSGEGRFKWARGETPFSAGDFFLADGIGEYELNGACEFIAVRT